MLYFVKGLVILSASLTLQVDTQLLPVTIYSHIHTLTHSLCHNHSHVHFALSLSQLTCLLGHRSFLKTTCSAASMADYALVVVAACDGEFEAGISQHSQTRAHILLAFVMGLPRYATTPPPNDKT